MFTVPRAAVSRKNRCWLLAVVLSVCAGIFTVHKGAGAAPQGEVESPMGRSGALGVPILSLRSVAPVDACAPSGRLQFVCGPKNVEDLVLVPHTHWIIASGLMAPGRLHLIDARAKTWRVLYPGDTPRQRQNRVTYSDCPSPPDPQKFSAHGLNVRTGARGLATLYVVNHGGREAIEVFDLDTNESEPAVTWIGCAVMPSGSNPNAVAPLPDGGFVVTSFVDAGKTFAQMFSGKNTGEVYEWHANTGFHSIPGTELAGDNGIEVSRNGNWMYVAATGGKTVTRYSLKDRPATPKVAKVDFAPDNIRWSSDGHLLVAGRATEISCGDTTITPASKVNIGCAHGVEVVAIDPDTMSVRLVLHESADAFSNISGALQVGGDLWLASVQSERVAYLPIPSLRDR